MHPFWISFGLFAVFLTVESVASWVFIRRSRRNHPELWIHAGSPTLLGDSDLISAWPTVRYLLRREYRQIKDVNATTFAEQLRTPMLVGFFGGWISATGVFACLFVYGKP